MFRYKAILLDMNGTFMFGQDRFGQDEDFFLTYQALGGDSLSADQVESAIRAVLDTMSAFDLDPATHDDFPSLTEAFQGHANLDESDIATLVGVVAHHELGHVPKAFADCLRRLAAVHHLGVVSNIWAPKDRWLRHFEEVEISSLWKTLVFSSDTRSIKPSTMLFHRAIGELGLRPAEILFVGDSLRADILPAKALGLDTAWVGASAKVHDAADFVAPSLLRLEETLG
jgi:putative hydrolase of the HAD superfamily